MTARRRLWSVGALLALPAWGNAQTPASEHASNAGDAPSAAQAQALSQDLIRTLAGVRILGQPPAVPQVGVVPRVDGGSALLAPTGALGVVDLNAYRRQLRSVFPESQDRYPMDSIVDVQQRRATAWMSRLLSVPAAEQAHAIGGWERVPLAELAALAGNDSAARRIFDARIAELASDPAQQSYALYELVATLADPTQDSARLARNVAIAEQYLKPLHALPVSGYKTRNDSTSVLERQWRSEDTLIVAYGVLGDSAHVVAHAKRALSYVPALGVSERQFPLNTTYGQVVRAFAQTPEGRTQLAAFSTPLLAMAHRASTEIPATATENQRRYAANIEPQLQSEVREVAAWLALLNTPAPAIKANLWLNKTDSLYGPQPRTVSFADGQVHVIAFGDVQSNARMYPLNRVHEAFPHGVETIFITSTSGSVGPDILEPADEVAWMRQYYKGARHLSTPIAIWAGGKVQTGFVPEGHYPVFSPVEEPNTNPYHARWLGLLGETCVIIDKRGIIRFYQNMATRAQEVVLHNRIQMLLNESTSGPSPSPSGVPVPPATSSPHDNVTL